MVRSSIGYKYQSNRSGNPIDVPTKRIDLKLASCNTTANVQSGEGIFDVVKSAWEKAKNFGAKASDAYSSELGTALRNMLPDSDANARPGFAGEKHAILKLPNGKMGVANYMGPGTKVLARVRRGDPPRTESDKIAMAHDVRYALTKDPVAIRNADQKMIRDLERIGREGKDDPYNVALGKNIMKAKVLGEQSGLLRRDLFTASAPAAAGSNEQKELMKQLAKLEQEGYGLPSSNLRASMMQEADKIRQKIKRKVKKGRGVVLAGAKGNGFTTSMSQGAGVVLAGTKGGKMAPESDVFLDFLEKKYSGKGAQDIAVAFAKQMSEKLVPDMLNKIKFFAGKSGGAKLKIANRSTYGAKMEKELLDTFRKTPQWMQNVRMSGSGLWDWIKSAAKVIAPQLVKLATPENISKVVGAIPVIGKYADPIAQAAAPLLKMGLSKIAGSGMLGSGFFGDFWEGLKYGWNKTKAVLSKLPVVGKIADAIPALPESKIQYKDGKLVMGKGLTSHHKRLYAKGSGVSLPGQGVSFPGSGVSLAGGKMKRKVKRRKGGAVRQIRGDPRIN